jgi:hypothetical protein
MRLLDLPQARHFCKPSSAIVAVTGTQSLGHFHMSIPNGVRSIHEGQKNFQVHQINVLNSVDQWLLFSIVNYRRAIDMLVPASAPWAQVTLYYASFFAANAILGMFGGWIGQSSKGPRFVDVDQGTPGNQVLRISRKLSSPNGAKGSHRVFWDFFYAATSQIMAWAPASLTGALVPVNSDYGWQINERNNVNYDMYEAWNAAKLFSSSFKSSRLDSLSGPLQLQFEKSELMIKLALHFAADVGLETAALVGCGQTGTITQVRKRLSTQLAPALVKQSAFQDF